MSDNAPAREAAQRRRIPAWVWLLVALGVILIAALIVATVAYLIPANSQGNAVKPQSKPTPAASEQPPPTETTEKAAPLPIVLPSCDILLPERYAIAAEFSARFPESEIKYGNFGFDRFPTQFGPATQTALSSAIQSQGCNYPSNMESGISLYTMELPAAPREAFIAALRADGDFVETSSGGAQVFVWEEELEGGHWFSAFTTHAFVGDVWIASYGPNPPETHMPIATAAILTANPELG